MGICIGYALDKFFGTKVVFLLVFSIFGCMAGMLNVYRSAQEIDKNIQKGKTIMKQIKKLYLVSSICNT